MCQARAAPGVAATGGRRGQPCGMNAGTVALEPSDCTQLCPQHLGLACWAQSTLATHPALSYEGTGGKQAPTALAVSTLQAWAQRSQPGAGPPRKALLLSRKGQLFPEQSEILKEDKCTEFSTSRNSHVKTQCYLWTAAGFAAQSLPCSKVRRNTFCHPLCQGGLRGEAKA